MTFHIEPRIQALKHLVERASKMTQRGPAYQSFYSEISQYAAAVEALAQLHSNRDPTITDAAHLKKVANYAKQLEKMVDPSLARMSQSVKRQLDDIDKRIASKVRLVPDQYASEVREVFRRLDKKDQLKMLMQLAEDNRGPELAAIVKAPRSLTGLSDEHAERFTRAIIEKHAPAEYADRQNVDEEFSNALGAVDPVKEVIAAYTNHAALVDITKAEAAAAAAARDFREATGTMPPYENR